MSALKDAPAWVLWSVSAFVAILLAVDFLGDHARKAAMSFAISQACSELAADYRRLWHDINQQEIAEQDVIVRLQELSESILRTTGRAGDVDLRTNERLNERCTQEADQFMVGRYVAQEA